MPAFFNRSRCFKQLIFKRLISDYRTKWIESDMTTRLKSRFKGYCIPVRSEKDIQPALDELLQLHKRIDKATHPAMYAWKIADSSITNGNSSSVKKLENYGKSDVMGKQNDESKLKQMFLIRKLQHLKIGHNDCKEPGSGDRLMGLLDRLRLVNVLVAVTRWYGGKLLGPSRFRCISDSALGALQKAKYTEITVDQHSWRDVYMFAQWKDRHE